MQHNTLLSEKITSLISTENIFMDDDFLEDVNSSYCCCADAHTDCTPKNFKELFNNGTLSKNDIKILIKELVSSYECGYRQVCIIKHESEKFEHESGIELLYLMLNEGRGLYHNFDISICKCKLEMFGLYCGNPETCLGIREELVVEDIRFYIYKFGNYYCYHMICDG